MPEPDTVSEPSTTAERPLFANRYNIIKLLGKGGMGTVYLAYDEHLKMDVALKVLQHEGLDEEEVERFMREAQAAAKLRHQNIVHVLNADFDQRGRPYIVMEFIDGWGLDTLLARRWRRLSKKKAADVPRLDDRHLLQVFIQVADALAYAHSQGVIHRDIKPSNVLVDGQGNAYLADFGLAKRLREESKAAKSLTKSGALMGTPAYMSPEQANGKSAYATPASDVFSFGVMLYEAFCGKLPFEGGNIWQVLAAVIRSEPSLPRQVRKSIHPDLDAIITKCLEKDARRRYSNGGELLLDLRRLTHGEPVSARPLTGMGLIWRRLKRRKALLGVMGVALLAVLVVGVMLWKQSAERMEAARRRLEEAQQLLSDAKRAFDADEYEKALELVNRSIAKERIGKAEELRKELIKRLREREQLARAKADVAKALASSPEEQVHILEKVVRGPLRNDATAQLHYGKALLALGKWKEAEKAFCYAGKLAEKSGKRDLAADAFVFAALALQFSVPGIAAKKDKTNPLTQGLMAHLEKAAQLEEAPGVATYLLSLLRRSSGAGRIKVEEATALLTTAEQALQKAPSNPYVLYLVGTLLVMMSKASEEGVKKKTLLRAEDSLTRAIAFFKKMRSDTWTAICFNYRGLSRYRIRRYEEALTDFRKAVHLWADYAGGWYNKAKAELKLDRYKEAIESNTRAASLFARDGKNTFAAHALFHRAIAQWKMGKINDSLADIEKALALNKDEAGAYLLKAEILSRRGEHGEAIALLKEAVNAARRSGDRENLFRALVNLGNAFFRKGDLTRALAHYQQAYDAGHRSAALLYNMGMVNHKLGNLNKALSLYQQALKYPKTKADEQVVVRSALLNSADILIRKKKYVKASRLLRKVTESDPNSWRAWLGLSYCYALLRDREQCLFALQKLLTIKKAMANVIAKHKAFQWLHSDAKFKRLVGSR